MIVVKDLCTYTVNYLRTLVVVPHCQRLFVVVVGDVCRKYHSHTYYSQQLIASVKIISP